MRCVVGDASLNSLTKASEATMITEPPEPPPMLVATSATSPTSTGSARYVASSASARLSPPSRASWINPFHRDGSRLGFAYSKGCPYGLRGIAPTLRT